MHSRYTWFDKTYSDFMMDVLYQLEPRKEPKGEILVDELEEFTEVLFFMTGMFDIGYSINKKNMFKLRFN